MNPKVPKKFTLCIRFQLSNSFVNTKVPRKFTFCIRFQVGNSFVNTKVPRKFTLCIRFQLGNSFVNPKVPSKFTSCIHCKLWLLEWCSWGCMITYHKNRHQGLSIIKFLIFAPSEMEDFIYIYVKNILGCKLSMHFTNNQRMFFFPLRQVRFTYIYIYIHVFVLLPPKHRTEFIIFWAPLCSFGAKSGKLRMCTYDHKISYVFMGSVNICSLYTP